MKCSLMLLCLLGLWQGIQGQTAARMEVTVNARRQLVFQVSFDGQPVIEEAPLGMNVDNCHIGSQVSRLRQTAVDGQLVTYELEQADGHRLLLDTRTFEDGVALRYRIPTEGSVCFGHLCGTDRGQSVPLSWGGPAGYGPQPCPVRLCGEQGAHGVGGHYRYPGSEVLA